MPFYKAKGCQAVVRFLLAGDGRFASLTHFEQMVIGSLPQHAWGLDIIEISCIPFDLLGVIEKSQILVVYSRH